MQKREVIDSHQTQYSKSTTRKHSSRMHTDCAIARMSSDRVANKDEQWPSSHEADYEQNNRRLLGHYLPLRSVSIRKTVSRIMSTFIACTGHQVRSYYVQHSNVCEFLQSQFAAPLKDA